MLIRMEDINAAGFCGLGARRWFHSRGIDFNDFMKNGIDADELIARGDHLAVVVVERKRKREQQDG
jgi:hypothetical protein